QLDTGSGRRVVGYHGSFWVDPHSLELLRLEVHADAIPAEVKLISSAITVEYAPILIGNRKFLLPAVAQLQVIKADRQLAKNEIAYSRCHALTAGSTPAFDQAHPQVLAQDEAKPETVDGIVLDTELTTPIIVRTAAVGDLIQARVRKEVKTSSGRIIPKGALIDGRILRLESVRLFTHYHFVPFYIYNLLEVELSTLRSLDTSLPIQGVVEHWRGVYTPSIQTGSINHFKTAFADVTSQEVVSAGLPAGTIPFLSGFEELPTGFLMQVKLLPTSAH
ncbi:MAG: hypothetical protein ABSG25_12545, partial [Bryobacteraceae bacterium]